MNCAASAQETSNIEQIAQTAGGIRFRYCDQLIRSLESLMARSRVSNAALARIFHDADQPLFVLDGERRIVFCNQRCETFAGVEASQLLGQRCDYTSDPSLDAAARAAALLCPPPQAFQGGCISGQVSAICQGAVVTRSATFQALLDDESELTGMLVVLGDQPPRGPADPLLPETNEQLHRAILQWNATAGAQPAVLLGNSPWACRLRAQSRLASQSTASVVISGNPASGRRQLAKHIYASRGNSESGLLPVDCPVTDPEMLQAMLTSVLAGRRNDTAVTLLLLDVDQLPAATQHELSGFLQLPTLDICTICTSVRPIQDVEEFDPTLAVRLTPLEMIVPPLAQRADDIPLLVQPLLEELNVGSDHQLAGFSSSALDQLTAYHWPGEFAELRQVVQQAANVAEGAQVEMSDLPGVIRHAKLARQYAPPEDESVQLDEFLATIERELITRALESEDGNKSAAAKKLGVSRARLLRRISQLSIG